MLLIYTKNFTHTNSLHEITTPPDDGLHVVQNMSHPGRKTVVKWECKKIWIASAVLFILGDAMKDKPEVDEKTKRLAKELGLSVAALLRKDTQSSIKGLAIQECGGRKFI